MIDHEHALKMAKMALLIDPDNRVAAAYLDMLKQLADAIRTLAPAQSGRGEPVSPLLPGLERALEVLLKNGWLGPPVCIRAEISLLKGEGRGNEHD